MNLEQNNREFNSDTLQHFLTKNHRRLAYDTWASVKHNFFYYGIPKTGCTTIKKLLQAHCNYIVPEAVNPIHKRGNGVFVKSLLDFNTEEQLQLLNSDTVFRFTFVRNPYTRCLSSYHNKVVGPKEYGSIKEKIREHLNIRNMSDPTFSEFLSFLISKRDANQDIHFRSQCRVCLFDEIDYNFIGRFEQFKDDAKKVLKKLNAKRELYSRLSTKENESFQDTSLDSIKLKEELHRYPNDRLYHCYNNDFEHFGYSRLKTHYE